MQAKTFAELGLSPLVQSAIDDAGYVNPTPIQAAAIPVAVTGRDVLGIAQTGTGKTASFTLPMISRLEKGRARARMPRSLILAPTRELAAQVAQSFEKYGVNHKLNLALLIGGVSMVEQTRKLDRGVDVLIATPGRLLDHFQRGRVMLMGVEILVIDEADRMLDMGFIPDIEKICKLLPPKRQTLFFSATMPPEITRLVNQFMNDPERIEVAKPATTAKTIKQMFCYCESEDWAKRERLRELLGAEDVKNAIIFCNRKRDVAILHKSLSKHGFNAGALHGDMDQKSRMETLDGFRSGEITLLVASDVAARGLDIPAVSHVFNYDLPWQSDDYVHRIGRTGRAGREGAATSLVTFEDLKLLSDIEKVTGDKPDWIGEEPSEEDFSESGKRKRRGGKSGRGRSSASSRPERSSPGRGRTRSGRSGRADDKPAETQLEAEATQAETTPDPAGAPARDSDGTEDGTRRRRRRGSPSAAGGQASRGEPRSGKDHKQDQDPAPVAADAEGADDQPRPDARSRRRSRPSQDETEGRREAKPSRSSRSSRSSRKSDGKGDAGDAVVAPAAGFADNIPAFLRRPVSRPKRTASKSAVDNAESTEDAKRSRKEKAAEAATAD